MYIAEYHISKKVAVKFSFILGWESLIGDVSLSFCSMNHVDSTRAVSVQQRLESALLRRLTGTFTDQTLALLCVAPNRCSMFNQQAVKILDTPWQHTIANARVHTSPLSFLCHTNITNSQRQRTSHASNFPTRPDSRVVHSRRFQMT